jgi:hypothetical protein
VEPEDFADGKISLLKNPDLCLDAGKAYKGSER